MAPILVESDTNNEATGSAGGTDIVENNGTVVITDNAAAASKLSIPPAIRDVFAGLKARLRNSVDDDDDDTSLSITGKTSQFTPTTIDDDGLVGGMLGHRDATQLSGVDGIDQQTEGNPHDMGTDIVERSHSSNSISKGKLSKFQSCAVLVNYISIGYILLPGGFAMGGVLLTTISLAFVSLQSYISGIYVLEACARAEAIESVEILTTRSRHGQRGLPRTYSLQIYERKFELSELCRYFMGRKIRNLFTLTTIGDLYGVTWTLSAVFGSALSDGIPMTGNADNDYMYYILIFMAITIPLSCVLLSDQIVVQLIFLSARLLMVILMIITTAVAYVSNKPHFGTQIGPAGDVPLADFSTITSTVVLCIFSTAFQFSIPNLSNETKNKQQMVPVIQSSVSFVYASNLVLALVVAIFFGLATDASSNLNWIDYHGGTYDGVGDHIRDNRSIWSTIISQYIVLFAAIDGIAVYPLCAVSLGEIMMGTIYEEKVHDIQNNWKIRTCFRLLACVPQAIGSLFVKDLSVIAKYAGIFTILSYTVCPCLLNISGRYRMDQENLMENTYYHTPFSSCIWSWILILISAILIAGVIAESIV